MKKPKNQIMPKEPDLFEGEEDMKINLMYCTTDLGTLDILPKDQGFIYNSNIANEQNLFNRRVLVNSEYSLWSSVNRESRELFPEFEGILERAVKREDLLAKAKIKQEDSKGIKLLKLSTLKFNPAGFYVQKVQKLSQFNPDGK